MEQQNHLPWPSIEQLPREICKRVARFLEIVDVAATCIQRAWRKSKGREANSRSCSLQRDPEWIAARRSSIHQLLLKAAAFDSEKLDGTNVGKTQHSKLLGRRFVIEEASKTYQGCPLAPLHSLNVNAFLDELHQILSPGKAVVDSAVYGELCCNPTLYSYQDRELSQSWQLFAAIVQFDDTASAQSAAELARAQGFVCICHTSATTVRVCNCPALTALFQRHNLPSIQSAAHESLCALVRQKREWMTSESGEGVVLVVEMGNETEAFKWKISRESQPGNVAQLAALISSLRPSGPASCKASLLDPQIHALLADLYAVCTHVDSQAVAPPEGGKGKKAPKSRAVDARLVQQALASALTKFDSLDAAFGQQGRDAVPMLVQRLTAEMVADVDLVLPGAESERALAVKEVEGDVKRFVTAAFGQFQSRSRRPQ